ncbi:MAG: sulfurtransferase TusA family protein [Gammaproteobacteria bacterium]|nr:sulfurtransferase TusA family protein [Gammaproteobacteria bacterium]
MSEHSLDARRLLCPMPVIRTQNKVNELLNGDTLVVTCTDPGVINDIPAWCRINGHEIIGTEQNDDDIIIKIKVKH